MGLVDPKTGAPMNMFSQGTGVPFYQYANNQMPGFNGITGDNGQLLSQYLLNNPASNIDELMKQLNGINLNTEGLEALRSRATGQGPSDWAKLMLQGQDVQYGADKDALQKKLGSGQASAFSQLAARGGASRGSRERLATKGMQGGLMANQDLSRQKELNRLSTLTTDEGQKLDLLKALPGAEVASLQPALQKTNMWATLANSEANRKVDVDKQNINSLLSNNTNQNSYNMNKYQSLMQGMAADRQATATENSGKK